ncbi:MAG: hypothetical protein U0326_25510 [Polyangiales bacterium]
MTQYPFRFYGREPADWTMSTEGFLYDVQFSKGLDAAAKETVRAIAERQFSRGPAEAGEVWSWADDRFLVFSVRPRVEDAARMIFTQVAEFLSVLHQTARIRDAVFCDGHGARADRWDAWTLQQSPQPDPGPKRPDTPWARRLKRHEITALEYVAAPAPQRHAAKPEGEKGRKRSSAKGPKPHRTSLDALPVSEAEELAVLGWNQLAAAFPEADLARIAGPSIPIGWVRTNGRNTAIVCFNAAGAPQRIEIPDGGGSLHLAVDPDGLHAVTHVGNSIYSVDVPAGTIRARTDIHENNGAVAAIAWAADDLWALRMDSQLMFFDLSEKDHLYVGTQQLQGALAGIYRLGTLAALYDGAVLRFVGVCDWQFTTLATMSARGCRLAVVDDVLYLTDAKGVSRVDGIDEVYEAWAAPLRRRAEEDRTRRMQPPAEGVRWRATSEAEMPPDRERTYHDALLKKYGPSTWAHIHENGDAIIAEPRPGYALSRGATFRRCPAKGRAKHLASATAALRYGVTCFAMDLSREVLFYVAGSNFSVHRVELLWDKSDPCDMQNFSTRTGLLFDIVALDRKNFLSIWNDTLDWHRPVGERWQVHTRFALDLPRENAFDRASRRLAITQQSRDRLVVLHVGAQGFTPIAACTDAVKLMSFREGRLFAQMIDGQWFELLGIDAPAS